MIDCKHYESIDVTPWHGDIFDHPSYQPFCHLRKQNILRSLCTRCEKYAPSCNAMTDAEIEFELWHLQNALDEDDRANPLSWAKTKRLLEQRKCLLDEKKHRLIDRLTDKKT